MNDEGSHKSTGTVNESYDKSSNTSDKHARKREWKSEILTTIMEHGDNEDRGSVRMAYVHEEKQKVNADHEFTCDKILN